MVGIIVVHSFDEIHDIKMPIFLISKNDVSVITPISFFRIGYRSMQLPGYFSS